MLFIIIFHCNFLDRNGLYLLEYSISKHGVGPLHSLDEIELMQNTRFILKHLWHFLMDVFKYYFLLAIPRNITGAC